MPCYGVNAFIKEFIGNYKSYVVTSQTYDDETLRDKMMTLPFITYLTFLSDVCSQLSCCSKSVQMSDRLPWKFPMLLDRLQDNVNDMIVELNTIKKALRKIQACISGCTITTETTR